MIHRTIDRAARFVAITCLALPCFAQKSELVPVDKEGISNAVERGVEILIEMQESYKAADETSYVAYVSEQNLVLDDNHTPVGHPQINDMFAGIENGRYVPRHNAAN